MNTKKITICAMLIAIGVATGHIIYIPFGVSKCFPIQHTINVISAVLLGPVYAIINAFCVSLLRNIIGTGSLLAFCGSMIGASICGVVYKYTKNITLTSIGEVFGTGLIGSIVAVPVSIFLMGSEAGAFTYVIPFTLSSLSGSIIAYFILKSNELLNIINIK